MTDFLDGWLARRVKATSRWGAMLDPIADRFFVLTVVATILFTGALGTGGVLHPDHARPRHRGRIPRVARDPLAAHRARSRRGCSGKVVTVLQLITLAALLVAPGGRAVAHRARRSSTSVLSIADYTLALWRARAR